MLTLSAVLREVPPDHEGGYELAREEFTVEAPSYEEARALVAAEVEQRSAGDGPDWMAISYRVDR